MGTYFPATFRIQNEYQTAQIISPAVAPVVYPTVLPSNQFSVKYFIFVLVVRDKHTGKTKGFGFVSFSDASDMAKALKENNGKYVGNRPIKLKKSSWKNRIDFEALQKQKSRVQKKLRPQKRIILHK